MYDFGAQHHSQMESILRREETGVRGENPQSQVEIDWNSTHITTFVVEVEGVIDFQQVQHR